MAPPAEIVLDEPTKQLCAAVSQGRQAPVRLAILAPGGYGKTAVLDQLEQGCLRAGTPVARFRSHGDPALVLVDDAHELGDADFAELLRIAADERFGLVIAARPAPRPAGLKEVLGRLRGQLVLRPLDTARTAQLAGGLPARLAEFVRTQTGGVPGFANDLSWALDSRNSTTEPEIPAAALTAFRHELDRADADTLRVLLAAEIGAAGDAELLAGLLESAQQRAGEVVDAARATGLLGQDGVLLPIAGVALRALLPADRRRAVFGRLAKLQLERGGQVLPFVRPLLGAGPGGAAQGGDTTTAAVFAAAAGEATSDDPSLAARLYDAAVAAGLPPTEIGAKRAEAVARAGDLDTALRLADEVIASADAPARAEGAMVAGAALAHRGQLARSTQLFRWSGSALSSVFATIGLLGTGRLDDARQQFARPPEDEPPTLLAGAMSAAAQGLLDTVSGSPTMALSTLVSSAEMLEPVGRSVLLPDSPAALGALVALHNGELAIAETLLERAIAAESGGRVLAVRHRLLLAWVAMVRGDAEVASARLASAGSGTGSGSGSGSGSGKSELAPRDWLFAVALRVGLARRASDVAGLRRIWGQAREAVIRHPVDLFTLLPFGEFAIAAARLGERDRLAPHLRQARELTSALGDPPLWTTTLHWSGLHSAITAERPEEAREEAAALAAASGPYAEALSTAAASWLRLIGGDIDRDEVEAAATGLHRAGLWWDGARLAGQAAIRTPDRKAMVALLETARLLQGGQAQAPRTEDAPPAPAGAPRLSERELQVAELVVAGMTYKQVGDRLFISAKTVEHHMARMRQRLGAASRSELLARLRTLLLPD
ncbi:helix-turn-helix domain-containing protein [Amycolatopsis palatopharyngis]|uniref:helix-turn-helix domain-containing protein n=1 Tax=Amycolatopsis palatopharyngis TaxID=187982 RepID=UPI000E26EE4D|nr:helix-turn-helix transcriptional regulator [Amycolatopsis palatopharyngis]